MRKKKASEFKAKCLVVMDEVAATGESVIITKAAGRLMAEPKDHTGLLAYLKGTGKIVDPKDDLIETFTPEEIAKFERHLLEEADEFLTQPAPKATRDRER